MDDTLKQRLIGALVLIALAVIFIPVFFDRDRAEPLDQQTIIPLPPIVEDVNVNPPVDDHDVDPAGDPRFLFSPREDTDLADKQEVEKPVAASQTKNSKLEKPTAKAIEVAVPEKVSAVPDSWVLQVASFSENSRAKDLQKKLNDKSDYRAFIKTIETPKGNRSRVYVGPKLDRKKIEQWKREIDTEFKVSSLVLKFEP